MTDWNTFTQALQNAPLGMQLFIKSSAASDFLDTLITEEVLDPKDKPACLSLTGDVLLRLVKSGDIPEELQKIGLPESTAQTVAIKLVAFSDQAQGDTTDTIEIADETPARAVPIHIDTQHDNPADQSPAINETEAEVAGIRTMQHDMAMAASAKAQVGYQKNPDATQSKPTEETQTSEEDAVVQALSQADTLEKRPNLSPIPKYDNH